MHFPKIKVKCIWNSDCDILYMKGLYCISFVLHLLLFYLNLGMAESADVCKILLVALKRMIQKSKLEKKVWPHYWKQARQEERIIWRIISKQISLKVMSSSTKNVEKGTQTCGTWEEQLNLRRRDLNLWLVNLTGRKTACFVENIASHHFQASNLGSKTTVEWKL